MRDILLWTLFIGIYLIISLLLLNSLSFYPFFGNKPLVLEVLKTKFDIPFGILFFVGIINMVLLFWLTKVTFTKNVALLAITVYLFSIWTSYLAFFNSLYTLGVTFLLIFALGIAWFRKKRSGLIFLITGAVGLIFSSLLFWPSLLFFLFLDYKSQIIPRKPRQIVLILSIFFIILLVGIGSINGNFKSLAQREVSIFSDV